MINEDTDKQICAAYPGLLRVGRDGTFGFECRSGWEGLIKTLCDLVAREKESEDLEELCFMQIKEKFGTLRVHYVGGNPVVRAYATFAEELSGKICEACGSPGKLVASSGWMRTRCTMHEEES